MSTAVISDKTSTMTRYGAQELKLWIEKHTYRSFLISLLAILIFVGSYSAFLYFTSRAASLKMKAPIVKMKITDLPPPPSNNADAPPPPPPPTQVQSVGGPASVAGTPVPVPETMLAPDAKEFASTDEISRATSKGGDGIDNGGIGDGDGNIQIDATREVVKEADPAEPSPDDFVAVEKEANLDYGELQKRVVYPEIAKRAGIEGTVVIRAFIGKNGRASKTLIDQSVNKSLDDAAIKAIMETAFTPAIQNGAPVGTWISIPVKFNLK